VYVDSDGRLGTVPASAGAEPRLPRPATLKANPAAQAMLNLEVQNLRATVTQQQQQIETLAAQVKENAAQIQKANAQLEMNRPTDKVVVNKP
jgi:Tfp pilus assembly protein FimV